MAILPNIPAAQILTRISRLLRPGLTREQMGLANLPFIHEAPDSIRKLAIADQILKPYTQPHTRRQFFKNLIGAPQRARQMKGINAQIEAPRYDEAGYEMALEESAYDPADFAAGQAGLSQKIDAFNEDITRMRSPHDPPLPDEFPVDEQPELWWVWSGKDAKKMGPEQLALDQALRAQFADTAPEVEGPHPATEWILNRILGSSRRRAGWD